MNDPRGSVWRKWDLQVHTPESLVHQYGGEDPWPQFISDLEQLPPEFKVVGINDYIFLHGYRRILQEQSKGRLKNIDLFLPVIELRIDKFGGTGGHLSRVNYHVIFSDELTPDVIEYVGSTAKSGDLGVCVGRGLELFGLEWPKCIDSLESWLAIDLKAVEPPHTGVGD